MLGFDLLVMIQICDGPREFKCPNKDLLSITYEYSEFVPTVTIKWEGLDIC